MKPTPDDADPRDYIFQPSLGLLPATIDHRGLAPVLDQGAEGACVGFALATVINVSLTRRARPARARRAPPERVSARMLYEMARRHDEWRGESYEGTSLRGAMKGWHKHGVTSDARWPYAARRGRRPAPVGSSPSSTASSTTSGTAHFRAAASSSHRSSIRPICAGRSSRHWPMCSGS